VSGLIPVTILPIEMDELGASFVLEMRISNPFKGDMKEKK